ncbi:hypothetical protein [Streptomyces lydicus]|uniref:hypothetical protein n=1 Tax=Streptomyces lydicus TaxID=47763 RepID=UPI00101122E1|nr:hypothetical protein [Streptomyces lydicus]MCZ1006353.1 hypothetical protein [Streptomyces lydicus]
MNVPLTITGAALSLIVLSLAIRTWWKGNRAFKPMLPSLWGVVIGASLLLCAGGLLGWVAVKSISANSAAGDWAVKRTTGHSGGALHSGGMGTLTTPGACVLVVVVALAIVVFTKASKTIRWKLLGGAYVGVTLCATAGVAQVMQWLPDTYNYAGQSIVDFFNGGVAL